MGSVDPETGIWDISIARKRHKLDEALARKIVETFPVPRLAADVACGTGMYCKLFKDLGWPEVHGYEGTQGIREIAVHDDIFIVDLTKHRVVDIAYDFVLCLETGEHIPETYEQVFMDNLCRYATEHLVLSWAVPGQYSASGHVNCRPNEYVAGQFQKRGFTYLPSHTKELRAAASLKWFRNTTMAFRRDP